MSTEFRLDICLERPVLTAYSTVLDRVFERVADRVWDIVVDIVAVIALDIVVSSVELTELFRVERPSDKEFSPTIL
jgi:hypothetical protein